LCFGNQAPAKLAAKPEPAADEDGEEKRSDPPAVAATPKDDSAGGALSTAAKEEYAAAQPAITASIAKVGKELGLAQTLVLDAPLEVIAAESGDMAGALLTELTASLARMVATLTASQKKAVAASISAPVLRVEVVADADVYEAKVADSTLIIRYSFSSGSDDVSIASLQQEEEAPAAPKKAAPAPVEPKAAPKAPTKPAKQPPVAAKEPAKPEPPAVVARELEEEPAAAQGGLSKAAQKDYNECKPKIDAALERIRTELALASALVLEAPMEALAADSGDQVGAILQETVGSLAKAVAALGSAHKTGLTAAITSPALVFQLATGDVYEAKLENGALVLAYSFDSGHDEVNVGPLLAALESAAVASVKEHAAAPSKAPAAAPPTASAEEPAPVKAEPPKPAVAKGRGKVEMFVFCT
jgi:hypothetical protein